MTSPTPDRRALRSPNMVDTPKRRRLQFSLRGFLVLLTLFCVWLGLHARSATRQAMVVAAAKASGGIACYVETQQPAVAFNVVQRPGESRKIAFFMILKYPVLRGSISTDHSGV